MYINIALDYTSRNLRSLLTWSNRLRWRTKTSGNDHRLNFFDIPCCSWLQNWHLHIPTSVIWKRKKKSHWYTMISLTALNARIWPNQCEVFPEHAVPSQAAATRRHNMNVVMTSFQHPYNVLCQLGYNLPTLRTYGFQLLDVCTEVFSARIHFWLKRRCNNVVLTSCAGWGS